MVACNNGSELYGEQQRITYLEKIKVFIKKLLTLI